ncbi:MAG: phosphoadenylyl-sulfate reductase [Nevskiaceae bacterium]|jgi:phosphoadenosine phosphosulfate reductase|nr:phosphoadenylyl-sulfate reductase [Nevskiaceae bacterium]
MPGSEATVDQSVTQALDAKVHSAVEVLRAAVRDYGKVVYSNSLGAESMVLTDLIWTQAPQIEIFSIDTGRLHEETYQLLDRLERRYQRRIRVVSPEAASIESYVAEHGINGFYNGLTERQSCCHIRKIEPFRRAIAGAGAWVTGVRHQQSAQRALAQAVEFDKPNGLYKISPILDWTNDDVWAYIRSHKLPYNPLHDRGYPSIGCAPCTRAVEPGADSRSGRWWWENSDLKECGLHPRVRVAGQKATG